MLSRWALHTMLGSAGIVVAVAGGCSTQPTRLTDTMGDDEARAAGNASEQHIGTIEDAFYERMDPGPRPGPAGAGAPKTPQPIDPDDLSAQQQASVACYPGLAAPNLLFCEQGVIRFQEIDSVQGTIGVETGKGLGPLFDGNSCALCHAEPAVLGSSPGLNSPEDPVPNPLVALATLDGADNFVPFFIEPDGPEREARSPVDDLVRPLFTISGRVDAPGCQAMQPDFGGLTAFRIPLPTFGDGLVENTPDSTLRATVAAGDASFGTGGTFNLAADGTIQRFGWKAQTKSLLEFSGTAYNSEIGVTNEILQDEVVDDAAVGAQCLDYTRKPEDSVETNPPPGATPSDTASDIENFAMAMRLSRPPAPATPPFTIGTTTITQQAVERGAKLFTEIGCASCHTPTLRTTVSSIDPAMSNVTYHPYSDFALHHMGPRLADGIRQGSAGPDQFRTVPLWGVGQRLFFLHDGRTKNLTMAILMHGGEAAPVVESFHWLRRRDQRDVVYFLRSL